MPLIKIKKQEKPQPVNYTNPTAALIQRRRLQILLHSYLYYRRDQSIVSDHQWAEWARELVQLQKDNPEISKQVIEYEQFKDFDASTGYHLQPDKKLIGKALKILEYERRRNQL